MILGDHVPSSSPGGPAFAADLHVIRLDRDAGVVATCRAWLDQSERQRAERFVHAEDGRRFIVAHGMLRHALGRRLGIAPADVAFHAPPGSKPRLHEDHGSRLRFNLSHSRDLALILIADGREVGVDIERTRLDVDHASVADRFFSSAERRGLMDAPSAARPARFFTLWTAKEAYSKARGLGMSLPLDAYDIRLDAHGRPCGVVDRMLPRNAKPWHVAAVDVADGFAAGIASQDPIRRLRLFGDAPEP